MKPNISRIQTRLFGLPQTCLFIEVAVAVAEPTAEPESATDVAVSKFSKTAFTFRRSTIELSKIIYTVLKPPCLPFHLK